MAFATKMEELHMEIKLTKRGQALVKRVGKVNQKRIVKESARKIYTLVHVEVKNGRKHEWSEKVWVDEFQLLSAYQPIGYKDNLSVAA